MLKIRNAQAEDCGAVAGVHAAAVEGIRTTLYTAEEIKAWATPKRREDYVELIRTKEFIVAEADGEIAGFGVLDAESAVVQAVYVNPHAGRRGIGLEILRELEERATALGLKRLRLNASLNAVPFYERAGYASQEKSTYRLSSGVEIACVPMAKTLVSETDKG